VQLLVSSLGVSAIYGWQERTVRDESTNQSTTIQKLVLHPKREPAHALQYAFLPGEYDLVDGNAATFYLKAMGFFERTNEQDKLREMERNAERTAREKGVDSSTLPPYSYLELAPADYPVDEVKQYLALSSFQSAYLEEARKRRFFAMDRDIAHVENPISYLLPEIQSIRELARKQCVRCRLAIAEDRIDDAIRILGQNYAMAKHLGSDDFFVSALVGVAISNITNWDAGYLVSHRDCPNLYWAYAQLPKMEASKFRSVDFERNWVFFQFPILKKVDLTPQSEAFWKGEVQRFASQAVEIYKGPIGTDIVENQALARKYLLDNTALQSTQLDPLPAEHVFFLAMKEYSRRTSDRLSKWFYVPYPEARKVMDKEVDSVKSEVESLGLFAKIPHDFMVTMPAFSMATIRHTQRQAMLQTIESIRDYADRNDGKLPSSLEQLVLPAPRDPASDLPFEYVVHGGEATLTSQYVNKNRFQYQIELVRD
jgi:hypothetical protein